DLGEACKLHRRRFDVGSVHFGAKLDEAASAGLAGAGKTAHDDDALVLVAQNILRHIPQPFLDYCSGANFVRARPPIASAISAASRVTCAWQRMIAASALIVPAAAASQ